LKPTDRKKVHLSRSAEDAKAAGVVRTPDPVILAINAEAAQAEGIVIMRAGKTVFLVDQVPPKFLQRHTMPVEDPA
jgi:putative RNA 2'-phosphotransferase